MLFREFIKKIFYNILPKKVAINHIYNKLCKDYVGKPINWSDPQDLNEKIQWLKINSDMTEWIKCADKYKVREYVKEKGLEEILVPLYGVYNTADEIDFSLLPNSFVLKVNNGSGDCIIVRDKSNINEAMIRKQLTVFLNRKFGLFQAEYHYLSIPPLIVIEELLLENEKTAKSLTDYKVWCFNGEPYCTFIVSDRTNEYIYMDLYDMDWNCINKHLSGSQHFRIGKGNIPKPTTFNLMMEAARRLSKGHPQVRVDFYEVKGKLYFGEMTFTSNGGYMRYFTPNYLLELGHQIKLFNNK